MTWREVLPYLLVTFVVGVAAKYGPRILNGDRKQVEASAASIANDAALKSMQATQLQQADYLNGLNTRVKAAEVQAQEARDRARRAEERADDAEEYIDELIEFLRANNLQAPARKRRPVTLTKDD